MTETLKYEHRGEVFCGQLARPNQPGARPGILVMHDGQGVGPFVRSKARQLADLGYVAMAADMFGGGRYYTKVGEGTQAVIDLRKQGDELRSRVTAAYDALKTSDGVDPKRIGAIGYCFGGQCVLEFARTGVDVRAVVGFHGTLTTHKQAGPASIYAKILVLTGARDPFAAHGDRLTFENEMIEAEADWTMTIYGAAMHGFTDSIADQARQVMDGVGYDQEVDELSWSAATSFLHKAFA